MTGTPTDISAISAYEWWELVMFKKEGEAYPFPQQHIGRCLGPAPNFGTELCYHVLTTTGKVVPCSTLRSLTPAERANSNVIERIKEFDKYIYDKFGSPRNSAPEPEEIKVDDIEELSDNEIDEKAVSSLPEQYMWESYLDENNNFESEIPDASDHSSEEDYETFLNAKVLLPQNGAHMRSATVIGRSKTYDGMEIGKFNPNPELDTRVYDIMFPDGAIEQYASNIIAQNILDQVDTEGRHYQLFDKIINHRMDGNESKVKKGCLSTKGHQLQVEWKDGTVEWIPLKDMKESFPIETAEYAHQNNLHNQPACLVGSTCH